MSNVAEVIIDAAKEILMFMARSTEPSNRHAHSVLDNLAEPLFLFRSKGLNFTEIAGFFSQCGIDLSPECIRDYYCQAQEKKLAVCEQFIADYYKLAWNSKIERTAIIERGLRQALKDERGLLLHYQPQVDMHTGEVLGAEALLRWEFNGSLVQPTEFIPVAEALGLIVPIGEWVLREACREAKRWQLLGLGGDRGMPVGVNLSVKQFSDSLPDQIHSILCDTGLSTNMLGLEITESFLVGDTSLDILQSLRDSGIHLSIDDFGTGYSCLAQLKDLPLDTLKIDRSFVKDLGLYRDSAVTETIIDLARKLRLTMLAEGVETEAQAEALKNLGCSVAQGFLYSKPLPGNEFVKYVQNTASAPRLRAV